MKRGSLLGALIIGAFSLATMGCSGTTASEDEDVPSSQAVVQNPEDEDQYAFLDAVRARFYEEVGRTSPQIDFEDAEIKVGESKDGTVFGFIHARPVYAGTTKDYDYMGTPIQRRIDDGIFDGNNLYAIVRKDNGEWKTVIYLDIGPTMPSWMNQYCKNGVPLSILPDIDGTDDCSAFQ